MRLPVLLLLVLGALVLPAQAQAQWGPREAAPEDILDASTPAYQLPDRSWVWLADGARVNNVQKAKWLQRDAAGAITARDLPGTYGGNSGFAPTIDLSAPDAAGTLFTFQSSSPYGTLRFPLGVDPSTPTLQSTPSNVGTLDVAPTGEAAATIAGGNALGVIFRPAGPDAVWDAKRTLNRGGAQRAYDIGITLDPDGGVFVVYETQQPASVLAAYAPPGGSFGTPTVVPAKNADYVRYAQSTNGHGIVTWRNPPANGSTTNTQLVYAATRAPGGNLGAPALLLDRTDRGQYHTAGADSAGITDDGSAYVGLADGPTLSPCSDNGDNGRLAQLARGRVGSPDWTSETVGGGDWPERADVPFITTAGNRVGVAVETTTDAGTRCAQNSPPTQLRYKVALGAGSTLGTFTTLYDRAEVDFGFSSMQALGVGQGGDALLLLKENRPQERLYVNAFTGSPLPDPVPETPGPGAPGLPGTPTGPGSTPTTPGGQQPPATPPLPAPGGVTFPAGFSVVDKQGTVTFKAGCAEASRDGIDICKVRVGFREALVTRPRAAAKAKSLGGLRTTIKAGKTKTLKVKLNKRGRKLAKRKRGVKVKVTVAITRGTASRTVTKTVTLKTKRK